jgi:hypothetical protein
MVKRKRKRTQSAKTRRAKRSRKPKPVVFEIREWDPVPGCHGWFPNLIPTKAAYGAGYLNPDRFLTGHVAYSRKDAIL